MLALACRRAPPLRVAPRCWSTTQCNPAPGDYAVFSIPSKRLKHRTEYWRFIGLLLYIFAPARIRIAKGSCYVLMTSWERNGWNLRDRYSQRAGAPVMLGTGCVLIDASSRLNQLLAANFVRALWKSTIGGFGISTTASATIREVNRAIVGIGELAGYWLARFFASNPARYCRRRAAQFVKDISTQRPWCYT